MRVLKLGSSNTEYDTWKNQTPEFDCSFCIYICSEGCFQVEMNTKLSGFEWQPEDLWDTPCHLIHLNYECADKITFNNFPNYDIVLLKGVLLIKNSFWKHVEHIGWFWFTAVWVSTAGTPLETSGLISKVTRKIYPA